MGYDLEVARCGKGNGDPKHRLAAAALADFVGMRDTPYGGRRFRPWGIRAVAL